MPRYFPPKCSKWSPEHPQFKRTQANKAIALDEMDDCEPSCNFFLQAPQEIHSGGWQYVNTYWNPNHVLAIIGPGYRSDSDSAIQSTVDDL